MGLALERDLSLLHRLEQRGLGLGRRAVHLVREYDVGEHRTEPDAERARRDLEDARPDDIARHQVGCELDPLEATADESGGRSREKRLRRAGHAFDEHVAAKGERHERETDRLVLTDDHLVNAVGESLGDVLCAHGLSFFATRRSIRATVRSSSLSRKRLASAASVARASTAMSGSSASAVTRIRSSGVAGSRP